MARSVVRAGAPRCDHCSLPPRWCVCLAIPPVSSDVKVDVLMHRREQWRPSSTGKLIERTVQGARCHLFQRETSRQAASCLAPAALLPDRELWILHPLGEPFPSMEAMDAMAAVADRPTLPQVLLLDGSWHEAGEMLRAVTGRGRCVRLSAPGPSRYWLREQTEQHHISTAEALLCVYNALGDTAAEECFRLHFELHVYATLRARGRRQLAEDFLRESPLRAALPTFLDQLNAGRGSPPLLISRARD
ncbi:MAG: DTW domain-containing protein [Planctomycetes bacterium]|nr:DTW domain-containing protein [Planctomycetota bacterium]